MQKLASPFLLRAICLVLSAVLFSATVSAMTIRELRVLALSDGRHGESFVLYYLVGAMEGAIEAHAQDVRNGAKPMICLDGRRLEPRMAQGLYNGELRRNAEVYEADMAAPLVMTNALTTAYPC
jgi:hypothetical protein